MRVIVASHNSAKIAEFKDLLKELKLEVIGLNELGMLEAIDETGNSFIENARIKAKAIAKSFPQDLIIADDSGICIAAFDLKPGIYSARFLSEYPDYKDKNKKVLELLENQSNRKAFFLCAIHIIYQQQGFDIQEVVYGNIAMESSGEDGFGYDPIFVPKGYNQTFAEVPELKSKISHRAKALKKAVEYVQFLY